MKTSTPRILIAGGGIGGLAAALALLKRGFDVEVYEQASELKEVGAGLQLSANGNRVLYALGVGDALKLMSCEARAKEIRLWNTGDTWKLFDLGAVSVERYGYPYFTVYRPDLLAVLAAAVRALKPDAIHLKARCAGFEQDDSGVTLLLESGQVRGDVLIGADGVHSKIRQGLFGADAPEFTGLIA
jgi:salicylate hydroxylase